jgi:hypothetical protein
MCLRARVAAVGNRVARLPFLSFVPAKADPVFANNALDPRLREVEQKIT